MINLIFTPAPVDGLAPLEYLWAPLWPIFGVIFRSGPAIIVSIIPKRLRIYFLKVFLQHQFDLELSEKVYSAV